MTVAEFPACIPERVAERDRMKVYAALLQVHAKFLEKLPVDDCLKAAFDVYANYFAKDQALAESLPQIPGFVFERGVLQKWLPYPPQRWVRGGGNLLEGWWRPSYYEPVPGDELTEMLGKLRMTTWYKADIMKRLGSRMAFWQAEQEPYHRMS